MKIVKCKICEKEFVKKKNTKIYCSAYCRDKAYMQKLYQDKDRHEHLKSLHRGYIHKEGARFTRYKSGAKSRKISFNLTKDEFLTFWDKPCFYCGDKVNGIGIDRLDNTKGYFMENCVACCTRCNRMKMEDSIEQFLSRCQQILNNLKK